MSKAEQLAQSGVTVAKSAEEALTASPCSILCLADYETGRKLVGTNNTLLPKRTVIQLTTGKPIEARGLASLIHENDGYYVAGSIMGFPNHVGTADNLILYSGDRTAFESQRRRLETLGENSVFGRRPRSGRSLGSEIGKVIGVGIGAED